MALTDTDNTFDRVPSNSPTLQHAAGLLSSGVRAVLFKGAVSLIMHTFTFTIANNYLAVFQKPREKTMCERIPPLPKSKEGHQKLVASPPTLRPGFFGFWGSGTRSRIRFLKILQNAHHFFRRQHLNNGWWSNAYTSYKTLAFVCLTLPRRFLHKWTAQVRGAEHARTEIASRAPSCASTGRSDAACA